MRHRTRPFGRRLGGELLSTTIGQQPNLVRIDAKTLAFKKTWPAPGVQSYYRGLAYGDGSLWAGGDRKAVTQFSPNAVRRVIGTAGPPGALAWSDASGDLWMTSFGNGSLMRLHPATGADSVIHSAAANPASVIADGDTVWVGDWSSPTVVRIPAIGSGAAHSISLPAHSPIAGVWTMATGDGYVWATTPDDDALWRIDPSTNRVTRITLPYPRRALRPTRTTSG